MLLSACLKVWAKQPFTCPQGSSEDAGSIFWKNFLSGLSITSGSELPKNRGWSSEGRWKCIWFCFTSFSFTAAFFLPKESREFPRKRVLDLLDYLPVGISFQGQFVVMCFLPTSSEMWPHQAQKAWNSSRERQSWVGGRMVLYPRSPPSSETYHVQS